MPMQLRHALDEKRIVKLFNDGLGAYLISKRFNCAYNTITEVLKRHGIQSTRLEKNRAENRGIQ